MAENVQPPKPRGKRPRRTKDSGARASTSKDLWKRVIRACEMEFQSTFGVPWNPVLTGLGRADNQLEEAAREVYLKLRAALLGTIGFVEKAKATRGVLMVNGKEIPITRGGPAVATLRSWVPRSIAPILRQTWMAELPEDLKERWPPLVSWRAGLVRVLEDFNVLGLPDLPDGSSRVLTVREMALVSLLAGNRPDLGGAPGEYTVGEVIKRESANIRPLLKARRKGTVDGAEADGFGEESKGG